MYKYFPELNKPNDFETYLRQKQFDYKIEKKRFIEDVKPLQDILLKYKDLFKRIDTLDILINASDGYNSDTLKPLSYEEWQSYGGFLTFKEENHYYIENLKNKINLSVNEIYNLLLNYLKYNQYFICMYPKLRTFLEETKNMLIDAMDDLEKRSSIELDYKKKPYIHKSPNAWYITPNGFLYNTGGNRGHKNGNLINPFYNIIYESLKKNKEIPIIDNYKEINTILKRGYITNEEFKYYANLMYDVPTILTPEVERDIEREKFIMDLPYEKFKKIKHEDLPHPRRSCQKNLITLVIGIFAAETSLFQSFVRLNDSQRKSEIFEELMNMCNNYLPDILVRFCQFHKIESMLNKTITTSSINGINDFKEYLDRGWELHIIPGIVYDKEIDKISEVDFNSYYIENHIEKQLNKYDYKGKVKILTYENKKTQ